MLTLYYVTLSTPEQAKTISHVLISARLAACTNWMPINSTYRWEGEIREESEVLLIVKSRPGMHAAISEVIAKHIDYTNCIAEIATEAVNPDFAEWLNKEV